MTSKTGISCKTVREIFHEHVRSLDKTFQFKTPRVLGLDGIFIERKKDENSMLRPERRQRAVFTDLEDTQVIDVRENCTTDELVAGITRIPGYEKIEIVVIDMSSALCKAVLQAMPWCIIVIDRFHIQRYASDSIDNVRKRLRKDAEKVEDEEVMCNKDLLRKHWHDLSAKEQTYLQGWFNLLPEMGLAYHAKEAYFKIWDSPSSEIARERYQKWLKQFPAELQADFKPLLSAMHNWGAYIFNYFDHRYTNAFTEQSNRQIRDILRASRNCSFKTYRGKLIYGTSLKKQMERWRQKRVEAAKRSKGVVTGRKRQKKAKRQELKKQRLLSKSPALQMSLLEGYRA
jgi:transposase